MPTIGEVNIAAEIQYGRDMPDFLFVVDRNPHLPGSRDWCTQTWIRERGGCYEFLSEQMTSQDAFSDPAFPRNCLAGYFGASDYRGGGRTAGSVHLEI